MDYEYLIVDVFTEQVFGGNQLAVLPDARGLSGQAMQAIAREFNFAESTFVLPPETPEGARRVRIFTPTTELRFAGHPTVGTAAALAHLGALELKDGTGQVVFEEGVGPVRVDIDATGAATFARLTLPGSIELPPQRPDRADVTRALSLPQTAILDCWNASVGIPFCMVHLSSAAEVDGAVLDRAAWSERLKESWAPQLFLFSGELRDGGAMHARMFAPGFGIGEDPATGSAAATLAGSLAERAPEPDYSVSLAVMQGVAMGRPSQMQASAERRGGKLTGISVGGSSAVFARGTLSVPG